MKTLKYLLAFILFFSFANHTIVAQDDEDDMVEEIDETQDTETITATYLGYDNGTYNFSYQEDGEEYEIYFDAISSEAKKQIDLDKKSYIGKVFEVTYIISSEIEESDDDESMESTLRTIINIIEL